jgi:hypothetical protein
METKNMWTKLLLFVFILATYSEGVEHDVERRETLSITPTATTFEMINTVNQQMITNLYNGMTIDICKLAHVGITSPNQLNFRAVTNGASYVDFVGIQNFIAVTVQDSSRCAVTIEDIHIMGARIYMMDTNAFRHCHGVLSKVREYWEAH